MWSHTKWHHLVPDANEGGTASSTAPPAATAAVDAKGAESSAAESTVDPVASRAELDSSLAKILEKHAPPEEEAPVGEVVEDDTPAKEETDAEVPPVEEEETPADTDDSEEKVPFHEHPRWKELQGKLKAAEADASRMSRIDEYCQQYNITSEQVGQALEMAALLNNDPLQAYQKIQELSTALSTYAGDKLPPDLEQAVKDGVVAPEYAKRMAKLEAEMNLLRRQGQVSQQRTAQQVQQEMMSAVDAWEQSVVTRDPDFKKKSALVEAQFITLRQRNPPRSAAQAVALAEQAYEAVNKHLSSFVQRPAIRPGPNGSSKKPSLAEPKSPHEVAARVMRKYLK